MSLSTRKEVIIIAGPTASGKSALALERAAQKNGVVINADSMQIYDALPTLTAQPSPAEQKRAPHRLYGILHPDERCDANKWRSLVLNEIGNAHDRSEIPIVTGGTGLYIKALLEGLSPIPDIPDHVRKEANALQKELGNPAFHSRLKEKDPVAAGKLHPNDTQRLLRAWEVYEATGKSLTYWQSLQRENKENEQFYFSVTLCLPERDYLHQKVESRFDKMIDLGALDEVAALRNLIKTGEVSNTALITNALGFHSLSNYLAGEISREEAVEKAKIETRQYAKRQRTWFRHQIDRNENVGVEILEK